MKTALIFIFLWGLSSALYINRFQRKWKGDDSEQKGALRHRYNNNFFRHMYFQAPPKYITYAKASDSSEENEDSSDEQEESVDAGKNGNNAASEETEAEESEGNGAEEDSEGAEEENEGTSAPEVEDSTASLNETSTDDGQQSSTAQESSTEVQPTQASTMEETAGVPTELPKSSDYDNLGTEEGSNGGVASTAPVYEPENNGYYYENGYYYHENEVDPRGVKGDTYGRYEDDYHYRNHLYQIYAQQYHQHYYQ